MYISKDEAVIIRDLADAIVNVHSEINDAREKIFNAMEKFCGLCIYRNPYDLDELTEICHDCDNFDKWQYNPTPPDES